MGVQEPEVAPGIGTPRGRYVATQTSALVQRLLALDDLWTAELRQASSRGPLQDSDVDTFRDLVDELRRGLGEMEARAAEIRYMLDETRDDQFEHAFSRIAESEDAPPDLAELALGNLADYELRGAAITACDYVREMAGAEADLLSEKLRTIEDLGEVPMGDWRIPFRCAGLMMLVGIGVAGTIGLGGPPVFVAMTTVSGVGLGVREWIKDDCPTHLPEIGFGRR
jgi:hypothetical protein